MENFKFEDKTGVVINVYKWNNVSNVRGVIQLAHGMTETAKRYDYFAQKLNEAGYIVYANDHRGHGETAKSKDELGYLGGDNGFELMVENMKQLTDIIKEENPNIPFILFGHSMGSFLSQRYTQKYGKGLDGLILSGTNGKPIPVTKLGVLVANMEVKLRGERAKSNLINYLSFGGFNKKFSPTRTEYDWLCSVDEEVDKYIEDGRCGFICTTSFYRDLFSGLLEIHKEDNLNSIPKNLPIYIFAGDKDPVGLQGKGIINLNNKLKEIGIENVKYKLYKDGRHEMLNEHNKDEVISETLEWLESLA